MTEKRVKEQLDKEGGPKGRHDREEQLDKEGGPNGHGREESQRTT